MDLEQLKNLQQELLGIISTMIIEDDEKEINNMQDQALKIISDEDFREHINDEIDGYTILDAINQCGKRVSQNYTEKRGLAEIERAVKNAGGKTSEELGKHSSLNNDSQLPFITGFTERIDNLLNRLIPVLVNIEAGISTASSIVYASNQEVQRPEIVGAVLGGLLITPTVLTGLLAVPRLVISILENRGVQYIEPRRLLLQSFREVISESSIGLSAALGAGITTLLRTRSEATLSGENIAFSLIAGTIAGTGAALSTALVRRAFTPISTNLENVATEQQNMQGQNR